MPRVFEKDSDATLDYQVNWATWLDDDTISTSTWTAEDGITIASSTNDTTTATVWLSGGTAKTTYDVTNRIVTAAGRTDERTIKVRVTSK